VKQVKNKSMFLQNKQTGVLIKVLDLESLINPLESVIPGRVQDGQEEQPPSTTAKTDLIFPSGESLPRCWMDADYREAE
jgi:hypothetical protein